jgi:DNA-binding transcriptional LysR family regulator
MKLQDVDLNLLLAFDALMRECHVTRAAERLDVSQSSMSVSLAKLRELFHDELLMRASGGLVPTERALQLRPRVQEAIGVVERVFEPLARFEPATATDTFRLIVIDYIDLVLMPIVVRRIRQEAPGVKLVLLQPNPHHFGDMLATGELDLAISYFPHPPDFLAARRLFSDRFVALCGADHPALTALPDVPAFCAMPHVTIEPDAAQIYNVQIDAALEPFGLRRRVQMVKPSFLALPFLLEATDMVACIPVRLARRMTRFARVDLFDIPLELPTFDVGMLWHPRTTGSPAHEWLRQLVLACAQDA